MNKDRYPEWLKVKRCRKVITKDVNGINNGILIDILNRNDNIMADRKAEMFQQFYMSTVLKGKFKGYHTHPYKQDTLHCVYGKFCLVIYPEAVSNVKAENYIIDTSKLIFIELGEDESVTVSYPSKYPHGFYGITEKAVIINYRTPAWVPEDTHQFDIKCDRTLEILENKYK